MIFMWVFVNIIITCLCAYQYKQKNKWELRKITPIVPWWVTTLVQYITANIIFYYINSHWGSYAATSAAAFGWLTVLVIMTDLKTAKVPYDAPHIAASIGVVALFISRPSLENLISFTACLIGVVGLSILARAVTHKGLGLSDVRILWATTACLSWWIGQNWILYGLVIACIIQLPIILVCNILNVGPLVTIQLSSKKSNNSENIDQANPPKKVRRELPFAPALTVGILSMVIYGTHISYGACQMWNVTGHCKSLF